MITFHMFWSTICPGDHILWLSDEVSVELCTVSTSYNLPWWWEKLLCDIMRKIFREQIWVLCVKIWVLYHTHSVPYSCGDICVTSILHLWSYSLKSCFCCLFAALINGIQLPDWFRMPCNVFSDWLLINKRQSNFCGHQTYWTVS